jgi:FdhE protein
MSDEYGIDKQVLAFIVFNSLKPSLHMFAQNLSEAYLKDAGAWEKGYCPVCGSTPELSIFEENGKRFLICGFCGHKWASRRIYCPFCENSDHETLHYFDIEGEEEHRADVCDKCKKYIKTTDVKKTTRLVYPPLEYQATPYIDLMIEEMGFKAGNIKQD